MAGNSLQAALLERAKREKARRSQEVDKYGAPKIGAENIQAAIDSRNNIDAKGAAMLNKAGESMTFGLVGDEAAGAFDALIGRGDYETRRDFYRDQESQLEQESPGAALAADIGGGVAGALLPFGAIGQSGNLAMNALKSGAMGAGMGGTYGFMEGEGGIDNRLSEAQTGMAWGAGAGLAAPLVGAGVQKVADKLVKRGPMKQALQSAQTAADQRGLSRAQYDIFEGSDAQFSAPAMQRLQDAVISRMDNAGTPKIPGALGKMPKAGRQIADTLYQMNDEVQRAAAAGQNPAVPLKALEDVRKAAGKLGREVDNIGRPTQGAFIAQQAVNEIDQFVEALSDADMPVGDVNAARSALSKARDLWKTSRKTQMVENAIDQSDNYLSGRESGLRNQIKSLLRRNQKEKLFTPEEVDALKKVIGNNMVSRTVRALGDGLGRKAAMFTGGAFGGLDGAAIGAVAGEAASQIGESAAVRNAEIARALISSGALQNLPKAPDAVRRITEALTRRIGAVGPQ